MTAQRLAANRGPIITIVAIVVLTLAGAGIWYLFFRAAGPAPVALGETPTQAATAVPATTGAPATDAPATDGAAATADPGASAATGGGGISGTWTVDPSVGSFGDFTGSFVGYRVQETLANVGAATAVGRTPDVSGSVTVDGTTVTAAEFTADLTTLQSDERMRDGQLSRQALETSQFPTATFKLTQPIELGDVVEGATVPATATGDLTLHGVTKSVQIPLEARLQDGVVTIVGSLPIQFADFDIASPQSMMVLSVEDHGILELQLQLTGAA